jgi:broad specificity phosphatase PhoE
VNRRRLPSLLLLCILGVTSTAWPQGVIFLVRHADRASTADDSLLGKAGEERAQCLAKTLKDANISAVFASDYKRTQQTAAPVAAEFHVETRVIPKANTAELVKQVQQHDNKPILVVGHADTLPGIVQALGAGSIPKIESQEYDRLIVIPVTAGKSQPAIILRFCSATTDAAGVDRTMH